MSFPLEDWLEACREHLDTFMQPLFTDGWPHTLPEPVRYPLFGGGKRVRPALALAAYQAVAPEPDDLAPVLPAMAAVEMIHTYSLVHDDLPALDDDDERRGRPTVHIAFGEPAAILVGDALLTEAFSVLAQAPILPALRIDAIQRLYRGFYGDDTAMFNDALSDLALEPARDTFIRHFGDGDQRSVRFEQAHFHQTFHQAFKSCAEDGGQLHQNFISLGLMLGCLYAHLEPLDMALDVRAAHDAALASAQQ